MDKLKAGQRALGIHTPKLPKRIYMASGKADAIPDTEGRRMFVLDHVESQPDYSNEEILKHFNVPPAAFEFQLELAKLEIAELHKMCNEKDEQIDKLSRPMVVRLDWWTIGIVALVFGAHYFGLM